MKRNFLFIGYELKYLFRQRFLQFLVLMICLFTIYGTPTGVYPKDWDYGIYDRYEKQQSYDNMTENQMTAIEFAKMRIEDILSQRNRIYETAVEQKKNLEHQEGYEWEYLTKAEEVYGKEISLKPRDYRGWESYFASKVMMLQHSKMALFTLMILVSAGLFLLSKDRTNRTLFWASYTGKGAAWSSYSMKLLAIFLYGFCVQLIQIVVQILTLVFISKYDMRQWLEPIQNISAFGNCCFSLNMIELLLLHIALLNIAALFVILFTMLLIRILKRDLLLIVCGMGVTGILYAHVYACDKSQIFDFFWRINPLSVVQMDQVLQYGAWNLAGHAVIVQAGVVCIWVMMLAALYVGAYQMWRRYLNETGV